MKSGKDDFYLFGRSGVLKVYNEFGKLNCKKYKGYENN